MQIVRFQDRNYVENPSASVDPKTTTVISTSSSADLAMLHNMVASALGDKGRCVNRFADKTAATRRTWKILQDYAAAQPKEKPAAKAPKKTRVMRFNFVPNSGTTVTALKNYNSLRGRVIGILNGDGATFAEVEAVVRQFDKDRGVPSKNVTRRAYEVIRIIHYYLGYGVKHNLETGIIQLYTK